jgi:CRP-like cAMP-binding protein
MPVASLPHAAIAPRQMFAPAIADGLEGIGRRMSIYRDQVLFCEGDEADYCYRILTGAIRITKIMPDGRRQVTDFFLPGDLVGFDFGERYAFSAEAILDTVLLKCARRQVELLASDRPEVQKDLLSLTLRRLAAAQHRIVDLGRKSATERVATFLLGLYEKNTSKSSFDISMSRSDIADYLGLTIETVSRAFTRLRQLRVIALPHAHQVQVTNLDLLEGMADGAGA